MYRTGNCKGTVEFVFWPTNGDREVFVAGDFSDWKPLAMQRRNDGVDGQWGPDPDHNNWTQTSFGSMGSLAMVR